jgi:hypothetical protein
MHPCPVSLGIDTHLVPWPGIKYACVKVLEAYCKVFNQQELYEFIVRYFFSFYFKNLKSESYKIYFFFLFLKENLFKLQMS